MDTDSEILHMRGEGDVRKDKQGGQCFKQEKKELQM